MAVLVLPCATICKYRLSSGKTPCGHLAHGSVPLVTLSSRNIRANTPRRPDAEDWRTAAVPKGLRAALTEPAFEMDWISYCLWWAPTDARWRSGTPASPDALDVPLGHLHLLVDDPAAYAQWATDYYERAVSLEAVRLVQEHTPLTPQLIQELNPEITLEDVAPHLDQIDYPVAP